MALARRFRLTRSDIKLVLKRGRTVKSSSFFIRFLKNSIGHLRLAIIIGTRVYKKAIARNRLKRIFSETIRLSNFLNNPADIVIIADKSIVGKASREIKSELEQTIEKTLGQHEKNNS